ncbi:MAG: hypothetical protein ACI4TD_09865, partial [Phocaeicola sp.]
TVTAKKPITITAGGTDDDGNPKEPTITTTEPTDEVIISPDGDPDHTVVYTGCPKDKEYGIHSGTLTDEEKVEIKEGTEYDLSVKLGDGQTTNIETNSTNPGTTTITKGKNENGEPDGSIVIESDKPNNDITVGDTKYTTSDENTKLVVKPGSEEGDEGTTGKPEVELKEGSVQLPPEGTVTLPNGEKVTNSTNPEEGSESVTVTDDNKVSVPDGAEATIGDDNDNIKISVPKGTPANLPTTVTPKQDENGNFTGVEIETKPGNDVTIGDETFTVGDYDTKFEVKPGTTNEDGTTSEPSVVVTDGSVKLQPGQSVTDSNGITYTNPEGSDGPIELSMTEGEDTEVKVGGGKEFTYKTPDGKENTFTNPGTEGTESKFTVSDEKGVSLGSDMKLPDNKEVDVDFNGENVKVQIPEGNKGQVTIDPTEGTITIEEDGDKVILDGEEYTASTGNTVLKPGKDGVELKEGGVSLKTDESIVTGGTEIKNSAGGNTPVEVSVDEDGKTTVKVPEDGGFTMKDPGSGESVSFKNPGTDSQEYELDDSGSLVLPKDSDISYTQGEGNNQKTTTIGSTGEEGVTIRPTENGVEITAPEGSGIKVNDVT